MRPALPCRLLALLAGALCALPLLLAPPASAGPAADAIGWTTTGKLGVARERAAGVLLNDGRVLVMGGQNCGSVSCTYFGTSEFYNPSAGTWTLGPSMSTARTDFEAVLLGNGKVLAIGGTNGSGNQSADLWNPATNLFSSGGSFSLAMDSGFVAVVLASGKVLVVGGCCGGAPYNQTTVIYDPATNTWANGPQLSTERYAPTATLLPNGKVLVAGGIDDDGDVLASTELYNPVTNTFSPGPGMFNERWSAQAALMPNGRVLVVGGVGDSGFLGESEVYNQVTNSFGDLVTGRPARTEQTANPVLTNDGRMLVAGGNGSLRTSELYDFATATWTSTPQLVAGRRDHVLLRLRTGLVLAAGGDNFSKSLRSAELFEPATLPTAYATPNPVIRGVNVTIAGAGFSPGETVRLTNNGVQFATATADGSGAFSVSVPTGGFTPRVYIDLATGLTSGRAAYFSAPVVAA